MATFTGTKANETIDIAGISPTVTSTDNHTSNAPDIINSKGGDDVVEGAGGDDQANLGSGDDRFIWKSTYPSGDGGSDTIIGGSGYDTLVFNGSGVDEAIDIGNDSGHAILEWDVSDVALDLNKVERIQLNTLGGEDSVDIGDLSGTHIKKIAIDLAGSPGANTGDGSLDNVFLNGTESQDDIVVTRTGSTIRVEGLQADVTIAHADAGLDGLGIKGYGGADRIDATDLPGGFNVLLVGEDGNDSLKGGAGDDQLSGGNDKDKLEGNKGDDFLDGGSQNDTLNGGKGDDYLDGGLGDDDLNGGGGDDRFFFANASFSGQPEDYSGFDTVKGFHRVAGAAFGDRIELQDAAFGSWSAAESSGNTVFTFDDDVYGDTATVTVKGVTGMVFNDDWIIV